MSQAAAHSLRHRYARHLTVVPRPGERPEPGPLFGLPEFAGRVGELSGYGNSAVLTVACALVRDAQRAGEPVAWLTPAAHAFYPPDAARAGVDLATLVVVRCPDAHAMLGAADKLARSGAFGLLVLDLGAWTEVGMAPLARLAGLAHKHNAAVVCLTEKPADTPSLGSPVALRGHAAFARRGDGRFACELDFIKDKRHGPGWRHEVACDGPPGLH